MDKHMLAWYTSSCFADVTFFRFKIIKKHGNKPQKFALSLSLHFAKCCNTKK